MNPYPQDKSILILDNCAIHKTCALREVVEGFGCVLLFLPPYSLDFNPIEESFSCGTSFDICKQLLMSLLQWNIGFRQTGARFKPPNIQRLCCWSCQQLLHWRRPGAGSFTLGVERTAFVRAWPCLPARAHVCLFPYSTLLIIFSLWICIPKQSYHTL